MDDLRRSRRPGIEIYISLAVGVRHMMVDIQPVSSRDVLIHLARAVWFAVKHDQQVAAVAAAGCKLLDRIETGQDAERLRQLVIDDDAAGLSQRLQTVAQSQRGSDGIAIGILVGGHYHGRSRHDPLRCFC